VAEPLVITLLELLVAPARLFIPLSVIRLGSKKTAAYMLFVILFSMIAGLAYGLVV
jgi:hypothetical protein